MVCLWERYLIHCASFALEPSNSMVRPTKGVPLQEARPGRKRFRRHLQACCGRYNFPKHNWQMQNCT
jgi:hypothetical protein